MKKLFEQIGRLLIEQKLSIAFAESATAGRLSAEFSLIENAGEFLHGGLICYDAHLKEKLLTVSPALIEKYTPESMEVTRAITIGLKQLIPADLHAGITGLTCPGGSESEEKPVGTMFMHCESRSGTLFSARILFNGTPEEIVMKTVEEFARLLLISLDTKNLTKIKTT